MTHRAPTTEDIIAPAPNRPAIPDKVALRRQLLAMRRAITPEQKTQWDDLIGQQLWQWCQRQQVPSLAVYAPIRNEPDLNATLVRLHQAGVQLCLPVVQQADSPLAFAHWSPQTAMTRDHFGVAVPAYPQWCPLPEYVLIPCVGFNAARFRLGYGGGFYDRTLAAASHPVCSIGIAYACLAQEFEAGEYDVALSRIVTEQGTC
ncbi:MAG: hypothetical protein RL748_2645 [Pseudomonadota bacterium]|jgi:5,10-methenyltetrahydrofolate synthetase